MAKYHVQLNSVRYQENIQDYLDDTIPHEVAHLITYVLHGREAKAHGNEWQSLMRALGVRPDRCHSYDTTNSAVAKAVYKFKCDCKVFELSSRRSEEHTSDLQSLMRISYAVFCLKQKTKSISSISS